MKIEYFLNTLKECLNVDFYTGVPDSQLKALCDFLYKSYGLGSKHIVAANEGAAVGLAAGHYMATGHPAMVYLQNSGIGNIINPVASLLDEKVYAIPSVFVIGWRGEPGVKDEPQHAFQGEVTLELLDVMKISNIVLSKETRDEDFLAYVQQCRDILASGKSIAFVVRKGAFETDIKPSYGNIGEMTREDTLKTIIASAGNSSVFVSTTGKTSRELFEIREALKQGHEKDFLTVGSMGHASMIAMGIAKNVPERTVWCIDGDGAAIMHLGSMAVIAKTRCKNMIHIVFNNGAHESVGGMPVAYGETNFTALADAMGYDICLKATDQNSLREAIKNIVSKEGTRFLEILVSLGSRDDLGRPTTTPKDNKAALMKYLKEEI